MITRDLVHANKHLSNRVQRWHTWPTLHKPNVGEHQCRVAQIYCELWGLPRAEVLYYCINHDRGEQYSGDVPFGAKTRVDGLGEAVNHAEKLGLEKQGVELPELTRNEWTKFKVCDLMEMLEFCHVEHMMGNNLADVPFKDLLEKIREHAYQLCETAKVDTYVNTIRRLG